MKLLVDTNIFLEILLEQSNSDISKKFLLESLHHDLFLSDYSFHSIGIILFHKNLHSSFELFINDVIFNLRIPLVNLNPNDMTSLTDNAKRYSLDFDDAYQYSLSEKYNLVIISYDKDFDKTKLGRMTPSDIISSHIQWPMGTKYWYFSLRSNRYFDNYILHIFSYTYTNNDAFIMIFHIISFILIIRLSNNIILCCAV
jgi:uncharacterized protein